MKKSKDNTLQVAGTTKGAVVTGSGVAKPKWSRFSFLDNTKMLVAAFIVVFGGIGSYLLIASHADSLTTTYAATGTQICIHNRVKGGCYVGNGYATGSALNVCSTKGDFIAPNPNDGRPDCFLPQNTMTIGAPYHCNAGDTLSGTTCTHTAAAPVTKPPTTTPTTPVTTPPPTTPGGNTGVAPTTPPAPATGAGSTAAITYAAIGTQNCIHNRVNGGCYVGNGYATGPNLNVCPKGDFIAADPNNGRPDCFLPQNTMTVGAPYHCNGTDKLSGTTCTHTATTSTQGAGPTGGTTASTTQYLKYAWSSCIYSVTKTATTYLTATQWHTAGSPTPTTPTTLIAGSSVFHYATTTTELFLKQPNASCGIHHLTETEWHTLGSPAASANSASFTLNAGNNTVYENGKAITTAEWQAAGSPTPKVANTVAAYSGDNDGCGGNAMHYNGSMHVGQTNFGSGSICKCANGKTVAYGTVYQGNTPNPACTTTSSSSSSSSSSGSSGSSGGSSSSGSSSSSTASGDGCGRNANHYTSANGQPVGQSDKGGVCECISGGKLVPYGKVYSNSQYNPGCGTTATAPPSGTVNRGVNPKVCTLDGDQYKVVNGVGECVDPPVTYSTVSCDTFYTETFNGESLGIVYAGTGKCTIPSNGSSVKATNGTGSGTKTCAQFGYDIQIGSYKYKAYDCYY